jgi:hypothetical protein
MRPQSIVWFERSYAIYWLLGLFNVLLTWRTNAHVIASAGLDRTIPGYQMVTAGLGLLIPVVLWYFITRRASVVAKWVLVVLYFLGLIGLIVALAMGRMPYGLPGVMGVASLLFQSLAVWMLFQPDARRWLAGGRGDPVV